MSRQLKAAALAALVFFAAGALFAQGAQVTRPAWPAYGLSIIVGFGTGFYYLGENGTPFLIGDAAGIGGIGVGYALILSSLLSFGTNPTSSSATTIGTTVIAGYGLIVVGGLVYVISRIWEDIAIFGAVDKERQAGKVAEIEPVLDIQNSSFEAGVSIHLQ